MLSTAVLPHVLQQPGLRYLTDTHCRRLLERYRVHGPLFYLLTVVVASQGWFTNPPQVTPTACILATSEACLYPRFNPD